MRLKTASCWLLLIAVPTVTAAGYVVQPHKPTQAEQQITAVFLLTMLLLVPVAIGGLVGLAFLFRYGWPIAGWAYLGLMMLLTMLLCRALPELAKFILTPCVIVTVSGLLAQAGMVFHLWRKLKG